MATAREKALEFLKNQGYSEGQIKDATQKVQNQLNSGQTASSVMNDVKSNTSSYFGGSAMYGSSSSNGSSSSSSSSSSSGLTSNNGSTNKNTTDIYGDVSGKSTATGPMDLSKGNEITATNAVFGENAKKRQAEDSNFLTNRNNDIAYSLYNKGITDSTGVSKFLSQFNDFNSASSEDRANTIRAISDRLSAIVKEKDTAGFKDVSDALNGNKGVDNSFIGKDGYYIDGNGKYQKIYGYDEMDDETKGLLDRMDDKQKKYVSNLWAQGMQDDIKYYLDTMRAKDQAAARQKNSQELYDINRESSLIQAEQTLRNAEESFNNLKQNWQYLGNMGMPGTSATKIQAIGDAITEAKTTLGEVKRLTQLSLDAQQKQWDGQVLQYNQQIDNLMYDLKWKVGDEITGALSKYTTAELEGKLDTIDGITAFRKELLDDLDSNLSGLTSASLTQMQWINQQYQDIANKMYDYAQNANIVNPEMSAVKGFYVDGNGNPILDSKGEIIQVPQSAPMEPVFDKETGKLITFAYDDNGQIVASVQQLWDSNTVSPQGTIAQLLQQGYSVADIMQYVPGADADTISKVAKAMGVEIEGGVVKGTGTDMFQFTDYTPITSSELQQGLANFMAKHPEKSHGGQCGSFVNDYLQSIGYSRLYTDPIDKKKAITNTTEPVIGGIAVMDSKSYPQYGHTAIIADVQEVQDGKTMVKLLESNRGDDEKVHTRWVNAKDILGVFDPSIAMSSNGTQGTAGYDPSLTRYYENWFKLTKDDRANALKEYGLNLQQFNKQMNNYFDAIEKTEGIESITALRDKAQELLDWNKANHGLHQGWADLQTYKNGSYSTLGGLIQGQTKAAEGIAMYNWIKNNQTLDKFIEAKKNGGTFGAMSEGEWKILGDSASELKWEINDAKFEEQLENMINTYNSKLKKLGVDTTKSTGGEKKTRTKQDGGNLSN